MGRVRFSRRRAAVLAGGYAAVAGVLTALLLSTDAHLAGLAGLHRQVYADVGFAGTPLIDDVSQDVDLDFLAGDPALPRRFFSVRWRGFWYVAEAEEVELHGAGDDRLDVWLDFTGLFHPLTRPFPVYRARAGAALSTAHLRVMAAGAPTPDAGEHARDVVLSADGRS